MKSNFQAITPPCGGRWRSRTGSKLLKLRLIQQEKDEATQTALTSAMVDAGCLWWFFWMQFLTAYFYGFPWFVGRSVSTFPIRYYLPPEGWGCTLPELFLAASIGLAVLALGRCLVMSRGARGRLRMMFLVLLSAALAVGFAWNVLSWRNLHLASLENYQIQMREHPENFHLGISGPEFLREQQETVESALAAYHRYWDHQAGRDPDSAVFGVLDGFALIPSGGYQMGNALEGTPDAPVGEVKVRAFYIAKHEVTKAMWDEVREWCWEEAAGMMGALRITRGGSWCEPATLCLVAESGLMPSDFTSEFLGFRVVRSAFPQE